LRRLFGGAGLAFAVPLLPVAAALARPLLVLRLPFRLGLLRLGLLRLRTLGRRLLGLRLLGPPLRALPLRLALPLFGLLFLLPGFGLRLLFGGRPALAALLPLPRLFGLRRLLLIGFCGGGLLPPGFGRLPTFRPLASLGRLLLLGGSFPALRPALAQQFLAGRRVLGDLEAARDGVPRLARRKRRSTAGGKGPGGRHDEREGKQRKGRAGEQSGFHVHRGFLVPV
jgi:hypothetical protein